MAVPFLRNDLIACAGVTAVVCAVAFLLWPHAANSNPPHPAAVPAHVAQSPTPASVSATTGSAANAAAPNAAASATPSKPSAYGEAFLPPPPAAPAHPLAADDFAGHTYPRVAPSVMAANLISAPAPSYPLLARIAHIRGQVTVQAVISRSGSVAAARAIDGHHLLRGAAVAAVRRQRYHPYRVDGQPTNVSTVVTVDFDTHS